VKIRRFDPGNDLIIVRAWLHGPRGQRPLSLAFDTAASETHIVPEIIDDLGYSHVHDLPDGIGIDGLLGLSFLRHFNYEVRSQEGRICIDRVAD
jgi:hypothetical protein